MPFYGKNPNNRGKTHHRLANHGLVDSNPYLADNYNPEDAVWRLMNAVNSTGGFSKEKKDKHNDANPTMVEAGGALIALALKISKTDLPQILKLPGVLFFGGLGSYFVGSGMGFYPLDAIAEEAIDETINGYLPGYGRPNYFMQIPDGI